MSAPEELFALQLRAVGIQVEREFKFHSIRKWRADFAIPSKMLLIEIEGGLFINGRHNRGKGMINDMDKYNNAALLGYRILRFSPAMVKSGDALQMVQEFIK